MPRPKSKTELIELSHSNYQKLIDWVNSYTKDEVEQEFPPGTLNRNIRDVLAHVHQWHVMMLDWYSVGMKGERPDMPAKGYTWKTTSALNRKIWEDYQQVKLEEVRKRLDQSFSQVQELIHKHTNEELFTKKLYKWTGSTSLGASLVSSTSSHYDWACKLIKKSLKV